MVDKEVSNSQILKELRQLIGGVGGEVGQLRDEVGQVKADMASLTRTVGRIDERLDDVEKQVSDIKEDTALIPGMSEAILTFADDLNDHEKRLKLLEAK